MSFLFRKKIQEKNERYQTERIHKFMLCYGIKVCLSHSFIRSLCGMKLYGKLCKSFEYDNDECFLISSHSSTLSRILGEIKRIILLFTLSVCMPFYISNDADFLTPTAVTEATHLCKLSALRR